MKTKCMKALLLILLASLISGCATLKVRDEVIGLYHAANGDFVVIEENGLASWAPLSKARDLQVTIGYLQLDGDGTSGRFVGPDISPYIGTEFIFSADYTQLSVQWHTYRGNVNSRATQYEKYD